MQVARRNDSRPNARSLAIWMAVVGVYWVLAMEIGRQYDLTMRTRALLDLIALAGFGYGLILGLRLWLTRDRDED